MDGDGRVHVAAGGAHNGRRRPTPIAMGWDGMESISRPGVLHGCGV